VTGLLDWLALAAFVAAFAVVLRTDPSRYRTARYEVTVLGLMLAGMALVLLGKVLDRG
jgi:hypothetical protein